jgi:hypothetical protein
VDQLMRLLHYCGMPPADADLLHGRGTAMHEVMTAAQPRSILFTGSQRVAEKLAVDFKGKVREEEGTRGSGRCRGRGEGPGEGKGGGGGRGGKGGGGGRGEGRGNRGGGRESGGRMCKGKRRCQGEGGRGREWKMGWVKV